MAGLPRIKFYADPLCPYAYLAAFRLRRAMGAFEGQVIVEPKCLAIEFVEGAPPSKRVLDQELPILMLEEPDIPHTPWHGDLSAFPTTSWPALEAVKCAQRQGLDAAWEMDWRLREAFFGESRCIARRSVILHVAKRAGLDMKRFEEDWDTGVAKRQVIEESRHGWEALGLDVSPTFVLPNGKRHANPAAPVVHTDAKRHHRVTHVDPAPAQGEGALDVYRAILREALTG